MSGPCPQVLFKNRQGDRPVGLEEYRRGGGYEALARCLREIPPLGVSRLVLEAGLRGRSGAGFLTGKKWLAVAPDAPQPRYVISNADEMEPGTFKDRVLIAADPHLIIEGQIIAAYAAGAERGIIFIRPSYEECAQVLERELAAARQAGLLGTNILGSGFSHDIVLHRSAGRYICGEATAQVNAIQGMRPHPVKRGPFITERGLWDRPTVLNNVETMACVPSIIERGGAWFRGLARSPGGAGTKLYCVSGQVRTPGCFELPIGTPLREIIQEHAGGLPAGMEFKACLTGGASTGYLPARHLDVEMDYDTMRAIGHELGTGAVVVFDRGTCLVAATINIIRFFVRESCGFCTPCREGLPFILDLLERIEAGEGKESFIPLLRSMARQMKKSYCGFAPGAANPVQSLLDGFPFELQEHISQRCCPYGEGGRSPHDPGKKAAPAPAVRTP